VVADGISRGTASVETETIPEDRLSMGHRAALDFIDKMERFSQFQERFDSTSGIDRIWDAFLENLELLFRIDVAALLLVDDETHEFRIHRVTDPEAAAWCEAEISLQIECGVFSWIVQRRQPALIPALQEARGKTVMLLPVATSKRTLGAVLLMSRVEGGAVTQETMRLLNFLTRQCSLVMENTVLYERLRSEHEQLQEAQERIVEAEKLASIGRLTSGASHEILNPLNIISTSVQLLQMRGDLDAKTAASLDLMKSQSDRIANVVKGLLRFSGKGEAKREEVDVNELVSRNLTFFAYEVKFHGIRLVEDLAGSLPPVLGDEEALSQAFLSVIRNATEAMADGGRLRVATCLSSPEAVRISVSDSGEGIPSKDIKKVFEPFFTTKASDNRTGLGLSTAYGVILEHKGHMTLESEVGKGTTVTMELPVTGLKEKSA
jgi:signal transduction histidine kinase